MKTLIVMLKLLLKKGIAKVNLNVKVIRNENVNRNERVDRNDKVASKERNCKS